MSDDLETRRALGLLILKAVSKDPQFLKSSCRRDKANIKFISYVTANNVANDFETNFILHYILLTTESCQLQDIIYQSLKPFLQPLTVYNGEGDLWINLEVSIVNKNELDVNRDTRIYQECDGILWNPNSIEFVKCVQESLYSIRNETRCPKIDVKYSDFFLLTSKILIPQ